MTDAAKAVGKSRGPQHGATEPSFRMIGELWSTHINHAVAHRTGMPLSQEVHLSAWDVAQMMSMLKKARALYGDATLGEHYADDIGYTGLAGGLAGASGSVALVDAVATAVQEAPAAVTVDPSPDHTGGGTPSDVPIPAFLNDKRKNRA
jgi:hypothetical protein